ncbi:MAG: cation:proton antiporter [Flavobacteriales bacterium]
MVHLPVLISDLALILGAAAIIILLFKKLKQPVVLGYIVAGLLVGPNFHLFPTIIEIESIRTWADIGVIFLLFSLGLEFSFKKLFKVGGVAIITAFAGVGMTMLTGYLAGRMMNWDNMTSLFLGGILAIASTTIIARAFNDLGVKTQKFTGIVLGVLVTEDLIAVLLMVMLSTVAISQSFAGIEMIESVLKLAFFLVLWFVGGIFFLPTFLKRIKNMINEETLLIVSLSLCFLMVFLATKAGFSSALGAFIMGSILAETTKAEKIEHLIQPLKNLFGAIFFVSVGMLIDPQMLILHAWPIVIATSVLLFGKPLFVTGGALLTGQPLKVAVQSGMSLSQIGEFSFIIASLGLSLGVTADFLYPIAVAVSVLTTFTTPFMIRLSEPMYHLLERRLPEKWTKALAAYSAGADKVSEESDWKKLLRFYFINVVIFSVVIITIILLSTEYLLPSFSHYTWGKVITLIITLLILGPFLWALAFRRTQRQAYANVWMKSLQRGPMVVLMLSRIFLAIFYIGFLFDRLYSPTVALIGALTTTAILVLFSKKIQNFYGRIESRFLSNLNERENQKIPAPALTPWDTHFATFKLRPQSPYIGKTLLESNLREEFGINIAIIERGDIYINVPSRDERLYPNDILSVIGTDKQLQDFKNYLESHTPGEEYIDKKQEVSLHHFRLCEQSSLIGKSIRESGIRELTKGLVVGIERGEQRILNPESRTVFKSDDILWIVGSEKRIQVLMKDNTDYPKK